MIREKNRESKLFYNFDLNNYVPQDHILRQVDQLIEFDFVRDKVKHLYSHTGKPAIDPVVLVKMLFIGYLYNIKSERQLEKEFQVNLAYKWFIKYDIDEPIPDHSVISQTRRRKFSNSSLFQDIFDQIVIKCMELHLLDGQTILTDSTHIKANASFESLKPVVEYLNELDRTAEKETISNDTHRSSTDPESKIMHRPGKPNGLHYLEHRSLDKSGFITDVFVTPGNASDHIPYVDRLIRQQDRFGFIIRNGVADKGYGYINVYHELAELDIRAFIPKKRDGISSDREFCKTDFQYDRGNDIYICPAGNQLCKREKIHVNGVDKSYIYAGKKSFCSKCGVRSKCTKDASGAAKTLKINIYEDDVNFQLEKKGSAEWKYFLKLRKYLVEGSFADAKVNHGLSRARMRSLNKVNEQCLLTAVVQNIKKMIRAMNKKESVIKKSQALFLYFFQFNSEATY